MSARVGSWLPLLLADPSPCLRLLVLRELLDRPDDDGEVQELRDLRTADTAIADLLTGQQADGSWRADGRVWQGGDARATALALVRMGYLGFGAE
ncbi:MAG TPA: hypothetical protein VM366_04670, partial [Anaerolineae bacterium]|nr:hypothetical protein [Anaerolineae bacterium]